MLLPPLQPESSLYPITLFSLSTLLHHRTSMARRDGRQPQELRQLSLETGLLSRADGSAKFSCGSVTVMASVSGPMEVRLRDELVDRAALEITIRPLRGLPGPHTKSLAHSLSCIFTPMLLLHRHPRSLVQLSLQTLSLPSTRYSKPFKTFDSSETDGSSSEASTAADHYQRTAVEKAAIINAAMCALVDSALGSKGMICACGLAILTPATLTSEDVKMEDEALPTIVLDPTAEEERDAQATMCIGFSYGQGVGGTEGDVCFLEMAKGSCSEEELLQCVDIARKACTSILAFIRKSQESRYGQ